MPNKMCQTEDEFINEVTEAYNQNLGAGCYVGGLLRIINRQKAEIERLSTLAKLGNMRANDYRVMRDRALKAEKEIERLQKHIQEGIDLAKQTQEMLKLVQAEVVKEFAERLRAKSVATTILYPIDEDNIIYESDIDETLKEMGCDSNV